MSTIPTRLLVINARVPEGAYCTGCDFCSPTLEPLDTDPPEGHYYVTGHVCCLPLEGCDGEEPEWDIDTAQPARLPACRERDRWRCYPPDADATIGRQVYEPKEPTK